MRLPYRSQTTSIPGILCRHLSIFPNHCQYRVTLKLCSEPSNFHTNISHTISYFISPASQNSTRPHNKHQPRHKTFTHFHSHRQPQQSRLSPLVSKSIATKHKTHHEASFAPPAHPTDPRARACVRLQLELCIYRAGIARAARRVYIRAASIEPSAPRDLHNDIISERGGINKAPAR